MTASALTDEELHGVVEAAALAPSVHNTQPWSFSWDGTAFSVYEDPARALPVIDPDGRERVISCGAALLNARLALASLGHATTVDLSPAQSSAALLGSVLLADGPASAGDAELAPAIARRHTDRGVFDPRTIPDDAVRRLETAAEREGAWLRPVERPEDKVALAVLLSSADEIEQRNPAYQEELTRWRTADRAEAGIPDAALAPDAPPVRGSDYVLRDFHAPTSSLPTRSDEPPVAEHPLVVVLGTEEDDRSSWLRAGMALGRVLLQATTDGLAASPMTQVVEIERLRQRLRQELGFAGWPQLVLRLGFGHEAMTTRRRPVDDVLQRR